MHQSVNKAIVRPRILRQIDRTNNVVRLPTSQPVLPTTYVLNACSLAKPHALEQLAADLESYSVDYALINETHFKTKHSDSLLTIDGYELFRRDRLGRRGGGVAIYAEANRGAQVWESDGSRAREEEVLWVRSTAGKPTYIGAIYHPPNPIYDTQSLLTSLEKDIERIDIESPGARIILGGDLNKLLPTEIEERTDLISIVGAPTRGVNHLDHILVRDALFEHVKVVKPVSKSDHMAIVAYSGDQKINRAKERRVCTYRKRTPTLHALFLSGLSRLHAGHFNLPTSDVQSAADEFYRLALALLNQFYPERSITMTSSEPNYVTPEIKADLRRKNSLMRRGKKEEADALAVRIGVKIIKQNTTELQHVGAGMDTKELWEKVRSLRGKGRKQNAAAPVNITAETLNTHYASVSTDPSYEQPSRKMTASPPIEPISEWQVFRLLDTLHHTATGLDALPAWFLRVGAPVFAAPIQQIFNLSLTTSEVPVQWKSAFIVPIPKINTPTCPADYRPISITSVLSRTIERYIVKSYIYPALITPPPTLGFRDQFAFRPTGSTTAALISFLYKVTTLLSTHHFVRVISLDFSKAFDSIRHVTTLQNLAKLQMPDNVYNWLVDYFEGHSHCTRFNGTMSSQAAINASVIQGSAIGPAAFIVAASDLAPITSNSDMSKYADDIILLVTSSLTSTCDDEISHIEQWSAAKNLRLNRTKSAEMLIRVRNTRPNDVPAPLPGIARVTEMKILGVVISDDLKVSAHVKATLASCEQSLYALRIMKAHGMQQNAIQTVFSATTLSKLTYCSPAWWGYASAGDRDRIEGFLRRCKRFGYHDLRSPSFAELCVIADNRLFNRVLSNADHVLHSLLPPRVETGYNLRPRRHDRALTAQSTRYSELNYLTRMMKNNCVDIKRSSKLL
jgi:hypothetical protein